jgi:hypothetical protein
MATARSPSANRNWTICVVTSAISATTVGGRRSRMNIASY